MKGSRSADWSCLTGRTKGELYRILEAGFVFRLDVFDDPSVYTRDPVLIPLPEFLRQVVVTEYKSGQVDISRRELATYAYANDSYVEKMKQYYEETQRYVLHVRAAGGSK